jgi:outer membrane protein TolC
MLKLKKIACLISILVLFTGLLAHAEQISLSLEECIVRAMRNNLSIAVEVLNPEIADISISMAKERFMPNLSFGYNRQNTNTPSISFIEGDETLTSNYYDYSARISQIIPTGGSFSIALFSYKIDSNQKFQTVNPRYGSTVSFNFAQPLLKNFGTKINRNEIIIARNNKDISDNQFKTMLMDTIYEVESAYWNLVHSIEDLKAKKQSLELARDLLEKNKREVEVGTLAPIEILSAESEVATREADILQAEVMIKNNEDQLKTVINLAAEGKVTDIEIIPVGQPDFKLREVSFEEALATALATRPDLRAIEIDIKNKEINLSYAKNQLLPELNLSASYWSPGVSGDQIIYDPLDPFGPPVMVIPGGPSDALKDALGLKFTNWSAGLVLNIPLNSVFSRTKHAQAKVDLKQTSLRLKEQKQQVILEIGNAVRTAQTNYKRMQAYRAARELAEKKLEAEEKKLKVGLTTNYVVLQYQRDLADARSFELRAMIDYVLSLAQLDRAMGTSLEKKNIQLSIYDVKNSD